jgi:hypothetical protein
MSAIRDTEMQVQLTHIGKSGTAVSTVTLRTLGAHALRVDSSSVEGPSVFVLNARSAYAKTGANQPHYIPRRAVAPAGITQIPLFSVLSGWNDQAMRVEYVGLEIQGNSSAHHVRITPPLPATAPGELESPCEVFIDPQSYLVLRIVYLTRAPENLRVSVPTEAAYFDYRVVAGIAVPFHVKYSIRSQLFREHRVISLP